MTRAVNKRKQCRPRRLRRVAAVLLAGVLVAPLAMWTWRWAHPPAPPQPPSLDLSDVDPAVRRAIEKTRAAVVDSPGSADTWGRLGMVLRGHGLPMEASNACFAQAERLEPRQPRWPYFLAISLLTTDVETAIAKLERAVELCRDAPDAPRLQLAEVLLEQGRLADAADQFQRVLQRHPANARAYLGLARLAYQRDDLAACLNHLAHSAEDAHTRKASHVLLAHVHERLGDQTAAGRELRRTSALPDDRAWPDPFFEEVDRLRVGKQASLTRADHLIRQGRHAEALASLGQTVQDHPDSGWAWVMFGRAHLGRNELTAAEEALRKAVQLHPDLAEARFYLGLALYHEKNYPAAAACFRKATELRPAYALAHYNLGHCLNEQGDNLGAIKAFQTAVNCTPNYAPAHVNLGRLMAQDGQTAQALIHLRLALQLNPADRDARKLLGQVLSRIAICVGPVTG